MDGMNSFLLFILPCVYSLSYIDTYIYSVLCYVILVCVILLLTTLTIVVTVC